MRFPRDSRVLFAALLSTSLLWACPTQAQGEFEPEPPMDEVAPGAPPPVRAYEPRHARDAVGNSFYGALSPYGRWHYSNRWGWVWTPHRHVVGAGFRPYVSAGEWAYSDEGWMFVSQHSWGWAPYHYGRWYRAP
ncbi:MAG: hypothetical protein JRH20_30010, partial [Deltaproteobacteria bacterium]|nr:hypothetical protein [Deltaproteobacteria bacterium]